MPLSRQQVCDSIVDFLQTRAAELLGVSFRQFRYKLQKHTSRGRDAAR